MVNPRTFISLIRGIVSGTSNSTLDSQLQSSVTEVLSQIGTGSSGSLATTTYITQTGNLVLPDYVATTDNVSQDYVITGSNNNAHTITFPTTMVNGVAKWQNGNGVTPDSTKMNYIYTQTKNGYIIFNTIKTALPAAPDVTAPTLSSPTASATGSTTATIGVTTNEGNGTLYAVVTTSATSPSAAQVKLGQNNAGASAAYAGNQAISSTGAKTFSATGLTASTTYYSYFMHEDASGNQSTVSAASSFTSSVASFSWGSFAAASESPTGQLNLTGTLGSGAVATTTIDATAPFETVWLNSSDATIVLLDDENSANYSFDGSNLYKCAAYTWLGVLYLSPNGGSNAFTTSTYNNWFKFKKSGNDILFQTSATELGTYTTHYTFTGVLASTTQLYPKAFKSAPNVGGTVILKKL